MTAIPFLGSMQGHRGFGGTPLAKQTTGNVGQASVVVVGTVGDVNVTPGGSVMIGNGANGRLYGHNNALFFK